MSGVAPAAAKTSSTWLSTPQSGGGCTPAGGGGRKDPAQLEDLAGVAVVRPRWSSRRGRRGGRRGPTRRQHARDPARTWRRTSRSRGRSSRPRTAGPERRLRPTRSSTPASAARRRACSKSSGAMSRPTTFAPRRAAGIATLPPVPVPTSSRSRPGRRSTRSRTTAPTGSISLAQLSQSPAAHVARARRRKSSGTPTRRS